MSNVQDDVLLLFFRNGTEMLDGLVCSEECEHRMTLSDCRQRLLDKQLSVLHRSVYSYNENKLLQVQEKQVRERLATLRTDEATSSEVLYAMEAMDEAARRALVRLVLYTESKEEADPSMVNRQLQSTGKMGREVLVDFIAMNQTAAAKLPEIAGYLQSGEWIFPNVNLKETASAMKFPQRRLERVQCMIARAMGMEPTFVTSELTRIFFDKATCDDNEYSKDEEVKIMFERLLSQMSTTVTNISLETQNNRMSDINEGGVTRVVSVNFSEAVVTDASAATANKSESLGARGAAPTKESMVEHDQSSSTSATMRSANANDDAADAMKKRQLRLASEAMALQNAMMQDLLSMSEVERSAKLEEAQQVSNQFVENAMKLSPGPERIAYLRQVDPKTQQLLAMQKLWTQYLASRGGGSSDGRAPGVSQ